MAIKSWRDFWSGLTCLVVGIAFSWGARSYAFGDSANPGPGYFPLGLGIILALLGAVVLFDALTIETEDGEPVGTIAWRPLLVISASVVLFGVLLPYLGILISLPILTVLSSWASDEFKWRTAGINAIVLTVASWLIFVKGLALSIPVLPLFLTTAAG